MLGTACRWGSSFRDRRAQIPEPNRFKSHFDGQLRQQGRIPMGVTRK
jgi:hypothetical protein